MGWFFKLKFMSKSFFIHIIATIIYIILALYIIQDAETNVGLRLLLVVLYLFSQLVTAAFCDINDFYKNNK